MTIQLIAIPLISQCQGAAYLVMFRWYVHTTHVIQGSPFLFSLLYISENLIPTFLTLKKKPHLKKMLLCAVHCTLFSMK